MTRRDGTVPEGRRPASESRGRSGRLATTRRRPQWPVLAASAVVAGLVLGGIATALIGNRGGTVPEAASPLPGGALASPEVNPTPMRSATATDRPTASPSAPPTASPYPEPRLVMQASAEGTLQYVIGLVDGPEGRLAAVSIANYGSVPATAPREGSGAIYRQAEDGGWARLETGATFEGVALDALLTAPDGTIVLLGHAADNAVGPVSGVWTSNDGATWTASDAMWLRESRWPEAVIAAGPVGYVQAGLVDGAVEVYWSDDARTWHHVHTIEPTDGGGIVDVQAAGAGPEGFVVAIRLEDGPLMIASSDGRSWHRAEPGTFGSTDIVMQVAPIGPDWVAAGWRGSDSAGIEIWRSADGLRWQPAGSIRPPTNDLEPFGSRLIYASHLVSTGERLILSGAYAVEGSETRPLWVWTSADAERWELADLGGDAEVRAVLATGTSLWLGGRIGRDDGEAAVWRWDPHFP